MTIKDDEALARALQAQFQSEYARVTTVPSAPPATRAPVIPPYVSFEPAPPSAPPGHQSFQDDEALARRVAQELHDEELARSIAARQNVRRVQHVVVQEPIQQSCSLRRSLVSTVTIFVIVTAVLVLWISVSNNTDDYGFRGFWPDEDPWEGTSPTDATRWNNGNNGGLNLEIYKAVNAEWAEFFDRAVQEWDDGSPDTLTLTVTPVQYDSSCQTVMGKLKVCNGNYGPTDWRGINEVMLQQGNIIVASTARLNDYYVPNEDRAQRQYTTCHEIGHGFGLPHTDENFYNDDLGNCMDYTTRPEVNESPDLSNFEFLRDLYGIVGGRRRLGDVDDLPERGVDNTAPVVEIPDHVLKRHGEALKELSSSRLDSPSDLGWKQLHQSDYGEAHEKDLGEEFSVRVHLLYPSQ